MSSIKLRLFEGQVEGLAPCLKCGGEVSIYIDKESIKRGQEYRYPIFISCKKCPLRFDMPSVYSDDHTEHFDLVSALYFMMQEWNKGYDKTSV